MQHWIYKMYQKEIVYFIVEGEKLLQNIKQCETIINEKRQKKLQINENEMINLIEMSKNVLRMITLIDCYRYLQLINEPFTDENQNWIYNLINNYYIYLLNSFISRLD